MCSRSATSSTTTVSPSNSKRTRGPFSRCTATSSCAKISTTRSTCSPTPSSSSRRDCQTAGPLWLPSGRRSDGPILCFKQKNRYACSLSTPTCSPWKTSISASLHESSKLRPNICFPMPPSCSSKFVRPSHATQSPSIPMKGCHSSGKTRRNSSAFAYRPMTAAIFGDILVI